MPEFTVHHELLKRSGRVRYRQFRRNGSEHYKIRVYIDGPLDRVARVQYELHPTFRAPTRESDDASDGFSISFWTYGEFEIAVTVFLQNRRHIDLTYQLAYSDELPADDDQYVDETSQDITG